MLATRIIFAHLLVVALITWALRQGMTESSLWEKAQQGRARSQRARYQDAAQPPPRRRARVPDRHVRRLEPRGRHLRDLLPVHPRRGRRRPRDRANLALQAIWFVSTALAVAFVYMPLIDRVNRRVLLAWSTVLQLAAFVPFIFFEVDVPHLADQRRAVRRRRRHRPAVAVPALERRAVPDAAAQHRAGLHVRRRADRARRLAPAAAVDRGLRASRRCRRSCSGCCWSAGWSASCSRPTPPAATSRRRRTRPTRASALHARAGRGAGQRISLRIWWTIVSSSAPGALRLAEQPLERSRRSSRACAAAGSAASRAACSARSRCPPPPTSGLAQRLHDRLVLLAEPQLGHLAARQELPALVAGAVAPRLDERRELRVAPLVGELDARALLGRERHALVEHALVLLERQVAQAQLGARRRAWSGPRARAPRCPCRRARARPTRGGGRP